MMSNKLHPSHEIGVEFTCIHFKWMRCLKNGFYFEKSPKISIKNSKVFEQKGDLLNFKANIDP